MPITIRRQSWLPFFIFLFAFSVSLLPANDEEVASQTGLYPDLFSVLTVNVAGSELAILFVYISERTFESRISPDLRQVLLPYVGQNALFVNPTVKQVVERFGFDPAQVVIEQDGAPPFIPGRGDWVEITVGFLDGVFNVNPMGASYGSGSAGVLVLGDHIDPSQPFWISYGGERVRFELAPVAQIEASPPAVSPPPSVPPADLSVVPEVSGKIDITGMEELFKDGHFDTEQLAVALNLRPALLGSLDLLGRSGELYLLLIQLENEMAEAALDSNLLETLRPLFGTGAVLVWAFTPTGTVFSPYYFWVTQSGRNYFFVSDASLLELTPGFSRKDHELAVDEIAAGVLLLPDTVDPRVALTVYYGSVGATFPGNPLP
jgi:hypothetical protein